MTKHGIRLALLGLVLVLGSGPGPAWSGEVFAPGAGPELFGDLIPGTPLADEELDRYYGRGLNLASLETFAESRTENFAEIVRERIEETLVELRAEVAAASHRAVEQTRARTDSAANRSRAAQQAVALQQARINARLASIRDRIAGATRR